jgi:hypothetical protein
MMLALGIAIFISVLALALPGLLYAASISLFGLMTE